ncbi:hypothetical protein FGRMN_2522 [Fusarium graminum]|nr:hypothetical protein FGRMN_2522 [Fusarium graminum]
MVRTDLNGCKIACARCVRGHREKDCVDAHPGPCFYSRGRGRPRIGETGRQEVPIQLLRPLQTVTANHSPLNQDTNQPQVVIGSFTGPAAGPSTFPRATTVDALPDNANVANPNAGDNVHSSPTESTISSFSELIDMDLFALPDNANIAGPNAGDDVYPWLPGSVDNSFSDLDDMAEFSRRIDELLER